MNKGLTFLFVFLTFFLSNGVLGGNITPNLKSRMNVDGKIKIIVRLKDRFDMKQVSLVLSPNLSKKDKTKVVVEMMKSFNNDSQAEIIRFMDSEIFNNDISDIKSYWISNVVVCYANSYAIEQLSQRADVESIDADVESQIIESVPGEITETEDVATHLTVVRALEANEYGYDGSGVIVAVLDSGINYKHNDIKDAMWTDEAFPYHGWDFCNNDNDPMDDNGHGSHCAGIIAGNGNSGIRTGVAPSTKIMAIKILDSKGYAQQSDVWEGIEFAAEHGANIISFSVGWVQTQSPDRQTWRDVMVNLESLNVILVAAVGNEGDKIGSLPLPKNVRTPGDCPAAWLHPDQENAGLTSGIISIGSTTEDGTKISGMSSRGPVTWSNISGYDDYPYKPGLTKPDVVAPGDRVVSLNGFNNNGYVTMSGTSMATPCVAGIVAAVLSKNPQLSVAEIVRHISQSAVPIFPKFNSSSGAGRADALLATLHVPNTGLDCIDMVIKEKCGYKDGVLNIKDGLAFDVKYENKSNANISNVKLTLSALNDNVFFNSDSFIIDNVASDSVVNLNDCFDCYTNGNIKIGDVITFVLEARSGDMISTNSFSFKVFDPILEFDKMEISEVEGNGNGIVERGETASLKFKVSNFGNEKAYNVDAKLKTDSPYIATIGESAPLKADIDEEVTFAFKVKIDNDIPEHCSAEFALSLRGDNIEEKSNFTLNIGKVSMLIIDKTRDNISANKLVSIIGQQDVFSYELLTDLPEQINRYESIWCMLGVYPNNSLLSLNDSKMLVEYLQNGGKLYMESGNIWWTGEDIPIVAKFNIKASADDGGAVSNINGIHGTFTENMNFEYHKEFASIDKIEALEPAFAILENEEPKFTTAIAFDSGIYKTIGSSIEIGGLIANDYELIDKYLSFFKVEPVSEIIETDKGLAQVAVYPNPSTGYFEIKGNYDSYEVIDMRGRVIFNSNTSQMVKLTSGLYIIKVIIKNVATVSKLIVN